MKNQKEYDEQLNEAELIVKNIKIKKYSKI